LGCHFYRGEMMKSCEHNWVAMEDGTLDKFCLKCSYKAKQAVNITINIQPTDINQIAKELHKSIQNYHREQGIT
jgi:hypothetical protein